MKILRLGIVGCGHIARAHLTALREVEAFQVVALCDVNVAVAQSLATLVNSNAPVFDDFGRMTREAKLDAALVCTPPTTHRDLVCALLENDIAVLCEKPLATTIEDARAMQNCAARHAQWLEPAFKFRFVPAVQAAREIIARGELGEVRHLEIAFCAPVEMRGRWNSDVALSGGGVLMDNGPHAIDLARFLSGEVVKTRAQATFSRDMKVEDNCALLLQMSSGADAHIDLSWSRAHHDEFFLKVRGSHGELRVGWTQSQRKTVLGGAWQAWKKGYDKNVALSAQLRHFAAHIEKQTIDTIVSSNDGAASIAIVQDAYKTIGESLR